MCRKGRYSFPWIAPFTLDLYLIMLSLKQGGIKYHFWVFCMTQPGTEPWSPGPLANTLTPIIIHRSNHNIVNRIFHRFRLGCKILHDQSQVDLKAWIPRPCSKLNSPIRRVALGEYQVSSASRSLEWFFIFMTLAKVFDAEELYLTLSKYCKNFWLNQVNSSLLLVFQRHPFLSEFVYYLLLPT